MSRAMVEAVDAAARRILERERRSALDRPFDPHLASLGWVIDALLVDSREVREAVDQLLDAGDLLVGRCSSADGPETVEAVERWRAAAAVLRCSAAVEVEQAMARYRRSETDDGEER